MENPKENQIKISNGSESGWSPEDKKRLACMIYPLLEMQKAYGRDLDIKLVMQGWEALLGKKYTVDQVLFALEKYALENSDFPAPANIHQILNPKKPRITEAQYVQACQVQKANNYPRFSYERSVIEEYEQQQFDSRKAYEGEVKQISSMGLGQIESLN